MRVVNRKEKYHLESFVILKPFPRAIIPQNFRPLGFVILEELRNKHTDSLTDILLLLKIDRDKEIFEIKCQEYMKFVFAKLLILPVKRECQSKSVFFYQT